MGFPLVKYKDIFSFKHSEVVFADWLVNSTPYQEIVL